MTIINSYVNVNGSPAPADPYPLLSRVTDDSNIDIGCVAGYHFDASNQKYAVVCLNAEHRPAATQVFTETSDMNNLNLPNAWDSSAYAQLNTATQNCDAILASLQTGTSPAVSNCRLKTFTISGIIYSGQLPTLGELMSIISFMTQINNSDPTVTQYSSRIISATTDYWCSTKNEPGEMWLLGGSRTSGKTYDMAPNRDCSILPVLEIPIN